MHGDDTNTIKAATAKAIADEVDEAAREHLDNNHDLAFSAARGEDVCGNCDGGEWISGEVCPDCKGSKKWCGVEPLHSYSESVGINCGEIEEALLAVLDTVAAGKVTAEKVAAGVVWPNRIHPDAVPLLDQLEALAPALARALALAEKIADLTETLDADDPRTATRRDCVEAYRADRAAEAGAGDAE